MTDEVRPATSAQVEEVIETSAGRMTKTQASYKVSLDIWIARFRLAQFEIRKMEAELEKKDAEIARLKVLSEHIMTQLTDAQMREVVSFMRSPHKSREIETLPPL